MTTLAERMLLPTSVGSTILSEDCSHVEELNSETKSQHSASLGSIQSVLHDLINPKSTDTYEKFKVQFKALAEWLKTNKKKHLMIINDLSKLICRCAKEEKFWPKEELSHLITTGLISSSACHTLITSLVDHGEILLVYHCMLYISDIPESAIVKCLEYFLVSDSTKFPNALDEAPFQMEGGATDVCPFTQTKASLINRVLAYPYDGVFLIDYLRMLDFSVVLVLLKYLLFLVNNNSSEEPSVKITIADEEKRNKMKTSSIPTLVQVVDWLNLVLDAHFSQMVLSNEARTFLVELHSAVEIKVQYFDELVSLESILTQLKEKSINPQKQNVGFYCIQTLHVH